MGKGRPDGRPFLVFFYLWFLIMVEMKFPALIIFLVFIPFQLFSQRPDKEPDQDKPLRIEIPARSDKETYRVIPCKEDGVLVFYRSLEQIDATHTKWYFTWYDQNLQQVWIKSVALLSDQDYILNDFSPDTLSLLFNHSGKTKAPFIDFGILRIQIQKGTFILNMGKIRENQEVVSFGVTGQVAWIGLNTRGGTGQFLYMNLSTGSLHPFALGEGSSLAIRWAGIDTINQNINAIVTRQVSKKVVEHYLVRYDTTGKIKSETILTTGTTGKEFSHFRAVQLPGSKFLILGSYRLGVANAKNKEEEVVSAGFFSLLVAAGIQKSIMFCNFLDFKNAGSLMSEKDMMSIRKKALKKNKNSGEFSLDFPLMFKDIMSVGDRFILTGEVYSPQYRTESFTDFDFYGRPYTNSYSVFDGFRFQNAIVAGFESDGRMVWDNVLEIRNLISYESTPKVSLYFEGNDLILSYLSDGKIGYKITNENSVLEKLDFVSLELFYPEDKLVMDSKSHMTSWYGNYFLCYGYQEIKNIALESNNKRTVFYINKVRFER